LRKLPGTNAPPRLLRAQQGDFGVDPSDPDHPNAYEGELAQRRVGLGMASFVRHHGAPKAILVSGDVVYPHGLAGEADMKMHAVMNRFPSQLFHTEWLATPGNHDCEGDMSAFASPKLWPNFTVPRTQGEGLFGARSFALPGGAALRILFLDACVLVCSGQAADPRCRHGLQRFSQEDKYQRVRQAQLAYLDAMPPTPRGDVLLVMAHWPLYSFWGNGPTKVLHDELLPRLQRLRVSAYVSGHDHALQLIEAQGLHFIVSGAGGYGHHQKVADGPVNKLAGAKLVRDQAAPGFVSLSASSGMLDVAFVDERGTVTFRQKIPLP
jgi:tartrate-resistant acid phosphatase type 5